MREIKLSGPVAAVILVIVALIVILIGYRTVNPPRELGPAAKALDQAYRRANPGVR
jgi:hypothetical protein